MTLFTCPIDYSIKYKEGFEIYVVLNWPGNPKFNALSNIIDGFPPKFRNSSYSFLTK